MSDKPEMSKDDGNNDNVHPYYPFLKWGFLHTPFMMYIRSYNTLSDEDFMKVFELRDYQKMSPPLPSFGCHVVFANDTEWTHIADDYRYTLWHSHKTVEAVAELSKSYDIFRCSIGDIDESFEFAYYQNGKLVRKFVFEHDVFKNTQVVIMDKGSRLVGEPLALNDLKSVAEKMFPSITQALVSNQSKA